MSIVVSDTWASHDSSVVFAEFVVTENLAKKRQVFISEMVAAMVSVIQS